MKKHHRDMQRQKRTYWFFGLGSLIWLLLRSGTNPRRLTYPCQRAALASSSGFLGYLVSLLGAVQLYRILKRKAALTGAGLFTLALLITVVLTGRRAPTPSVFASVSELPGWTSSTAISNVFVVPNVPVPECSLNGGALPATSPCNDASYALRDAGVDKLVNEMERRGDYFFQTASHPSGIVGADDVVVIKINNQWIGDGSSYGRLSTNTDVLKGLIWRILQHPDGFTGEVVVVENTQDVNPEWNSTPANAEDQNQSYQDAIATFQNLSYAVSAFGWDDLNYSLISGGNVGGSGYPSGEYARGNMTDAYILLEDPDGTGADELSYPKFQTAGGSYVSMRYGIWNGSSYDADRLTFINVPVIKNHGMAGATIAWKNLIGFVTISDYNRRYGSSGASDDTNWDEMHDFFWGYTEGNNNGYGLVGRELALIRTPDLNVVDAIWVAIDDNTSGNAVRQNVLLASSDPFAVDWYASEYVLRPIVPSEAQDASAARAGVFRSATRVNQNAAASKWSSGSYPYMDLLDSYDGNTPSANEKSQMNVYIISGETLCESITDVGIAGPTKGFTNTFNIFTAVITPSAATTPITYTWSPGPDSGQRTASAQYEWGTSGVYTITLGAENCGGSDIASHAIVITDERQDVYLPLVLRSHTPTSTGSRIPLPSSGHIYHAVYPGGVTGWGEEDDVTLNDLRSYEQLAGKTAVWVYFSHNWFRGRSFPLTTTTWIRDAGSLAYIRLMLRSDAEQDHAEPTFTLDRIINGDFDNDLRAWARDARDFGSPLIAEYGTEVNGEWFSWNGIWNGGGTTDGYGDPTEYDGPERFRDAYRHIIQVVRGEGASNITWVFHVDDEDVPDENWNRLEHYYPGDEWVDWIGVSVYGAGTPMDTECARFRDDMDAVYPRLTALSADKPIVLLEFGVTSSNPYCEQATWAEDALKDLIALRWPRVSGFSWWNERWENDDNPSHNTNMRIQDNPALAAVFQRLVGGDPKVLGKLETQSSAWELSQRSY